MNYFTLTDRCHHWDAEPHQSYVVEFLVIAPLETIVSEGIRRSHDRLHYLCNEYPCNEVRWPVSVAYASVHNGVYDCPRLGLKTRKVGTCSQICTQSTPKRHQLMKCPTSYATAISFFPAPGEGPRSAQWERFCIDLVRID